MYTDVDWLSFMQVCCCCTAYLDTPVCLLFSRHTCSGESVVDFLILNAVSMCCVSWALILSNAKFLLFEAKLLCSAGFGA